ncbi:MAG: DUF6263 family protein [Tepidisphaeraceae bacterium]|jgi:hypothetical protein
MLCRTSVAAVAVLLAASFCLAQTGEKIKVHVAYPPGMYVMTQTDEGDTTVRFGEQEMKTRSSETAVWELAVAKPNDKGDKQVTLKLVRIKTTDVGEKTMSFDSDRPGEGDPAKAFVYKPLIGMPVQITLDSDDSVIEVAGLDRLWNELAAKARTDDEKSLVVETRMGLGDKAIEQALRRLECVSPKNAVSANDTWKGSMRADMPMIGEIKARYDCKLQSVDAAAAGPVAVIASEGKYESTNPKASKINGIDVMVTRLDVVEKGTLRVDVKTGLAQADRRTVDVNADVKAKGQDGKDVNVGVKTANNSTMTIEPKKPGGPIVVPGVEDAPAPRAAAGALGDATYGYKQENPIAIGGENQARAYVRRLRDSKGQKPQIGRITTLAGEVDVYELGTSDGPVKLYVYWGPLKADPSTWKAPKGMSLAAE